MNVCNFSKGELNGLDQIIKRELRSNQMLGNQASNDRLYLKREDGNQASNDRLYLKREDGGRESKSMRNVYKETRLRVVCYMSKSENRWIQATWRRETLQAQNPIVTEARTTMEEVGRKLKFEDNTIQLELN